MNKKYLSVVLFGALLATSAGTFTSCKDYDDDIKGLQEQIDGNQSSVAALEKQLATLDAAAKAAQTAADAAKAAAAEAKTAADAAKAAGDQAKADAATAKALAEEAKAAVATAKAEAIAEATKQVEALQALLQASIDGKVDQKVYDAAIIAIGGRIDGIEDGLNKLTTGQVATNTEDIKNAKDAIATLMAAYENLKIQSAVLEEYKKALDDIKDNADDIQDNADAIRTANTNIGLAQEEIENLWSAINGKGGLKDLIQGNADAINNLKTQTADDIEALEGRINDQLNDIKDDITENIKPAITTIQEQIKDEILPDLAQLHVLIVARLSSISFAPDLYVDGIEAIKFTSLQYSPMDKSENASIPVTYKFSTAALATASYHFNPVSFKLANADYAYIDRTAEVINTRAAASKLVEIVGTPTANAVTGTVDFQLLRLNSHTTQPGLDRTNLIALQATLKGDAVDTNEKNAVVTAPYVAVYDNILAYEDVRIADKKTLTTGADEAHYATTFNACKDEDPRYKMYYDKVFDLKELVATCFGNNGHDEFPIEDYKLSYRFAVASTKYDITVGQTTTEQQKWIKCNDAEAGLYQAEDFNPEAFGRTPILKVELVDEAGNVVRRGFVKVRIEAEKKEDITVNKEAYDLTYACAETKATYTIDEEFIRENVYRKITNGTNVGMSHEEFWNTYNFASAEVKKNNKVYGMATPRIVDGPTGAGVATKKIVWDFTHGQLGQISASGSQFVATVTVKNKLQSSKYPEKITFKFTVNVKLPSFTLNTTQNEQYWQTVDGEMRFFKVNAVTPETKEDHADMCQIYQDLTRAYTVYNLKGLPACTEAYYKVTRTYSNGTATPKVMTGVQIFGDMISLDKNASDVKAALNSANGLQASVAHIYVLESGDEITVNEFMVNFIRPVNLNMPSGITLQDAKTGGDIANFSWNGLLTDWRGEAIISPSVVEVEDINSFWKKVCVPEYELTEGHYEIVTPASLKVETGEVDFITTRTITMYSGKVTYTYKEIGGQGTTTANYSTAKPMLTKAEVNSDLNTQALAGTPEGYELESSDEVVYTEVPVSEDTHVTYTYVKEVQYVPAEVKWVEGVHTVKPHEDTEMPAYEGTSYGQKVGCWEWSKSVFSNSELNLGQYWFFYGQFSEVKLDVNKVTTNLKYNGGKLPDNATLEQVPNTNTVKYVNVNSPIEYTYELYIPASVNYGWGTLNAVLTIKVNPAGK